MAFRFKSFPVYDEVRIFIQDIYKITNTLPKTEQFNIISQLKRAATSILLNIAEGSVRNSDAELNRFLLISIGSTGEVVAILDICLDCGYITPSIHEEFMVKCENITKQLYGFKRILKVKTDK